MIIGLVGFIGAGKGTVSDYLCSHYGFTKDSFAKPVKDAVAAIFGWDRALLEGDTETSRNFRERVDPYWSEKLNDPAFTPRKALQLMGTEAGRDVFGRDLWAASAIHRISNIGSSNAVISDTRFINEINMIRSVGGKIIRVQRGPDPYWFSEISNLRARDNSFSYISELMTERGVHQSEWDWVGTPVDATITNNSTLSLLYEQIDYTMEALKDIYNDKA